MLRNIVIIVNPVSYTHLLRYYTAPIPGIKVNASELSVTLPNGSMIRIFGADNPDALRGGYFDIVVLDEVAQMKPEVWHEIIRPALAARGGSAVFIGTPKGQNLFKELFDRGLKGDDPEWTSVMYRADETGVDVYQRQQEWTYGTLERVKRVVFHALRFFIGLANRRGKCEGQRIGQIRRTPQTFLDFFLALQHHFSGSIEQVCRRR